MSDSNISYDPAELKVLAQLQERHFWFGARRRIIIDALRRSFGPSARRYLEIGAGTGYNARGIADAFPLWEVTASDPLAEEGAPIRRINALDIPFENEFDVIGAYDVLEHIANDSAAIQQFRKALKPGGGLLLTVPQHPWLWSTADAHAQHHRRYTSCGLLHLLKTTGFEVVDSNSFLTTSFPLFVVRTKLLSSIGRAPSPKAPPAPINWLLAQSMNFDALLIRAHIHLPFGGSLIVAARRAK